MVLLLAPLLGKSFFLWVNTSTQVKALSWSELQRIRILSDPPSFIGLGKPEINLHGQKNKTLQKINPEAYNHPLTKMAVSAPLHTKVQSHFVMLYE